MALLPQSPTNYGPPLLDFSPLGQLGDQYFKGAEERRKYDVARAFQGGVPKKPDGTPDFAAMAETLARAGAPDQVIPYSREALDREQLSAAQGGGVQPPPVGDVSLPRGERNNNPGNLVASNFTQSQPGYVGSDGKFGQFDKNESGVAAASKLLENYGRQGINTVQGVIGKWAPSSDGNNVAQYAGYVAKQAGVNPNDPIDLADSAVRGKVLRGMFAFENGRQTKAAEIPAAAQPTSGAAPSNANMALANSLAQANGYPDFRTALSEIHREIRPLVGNPHAKDYVASRLALAKEIGATLTSPDTQGNIDRAFTEQKRQHDLLAGKPVPVPPGTQLVDPLSGQPIFQSDTGLLDKPTIDAMARQAMSGDTSVFTNLGRGAQGAENVIAVRKRIAELNSGSGETGSEQAMRNAEFFGVKAGQRTLGARSANIELAATEFKQVLPVVLEASRAVNRTNYPDLNKIIQMFEEKTGDPNIVKFGGGVNTLVNLYARAISPTGQTTVSDKDHARLILNRAWSQGQFDAAVGMMSQEIDAALSSPDKVRDAMRQRFLEGQSGAKPTSGASAPASTAPAQAQPPAAGKPKTVIQNGHTYELQSDGSYK